MEIFVTCKLDANGVLGFIRPIANLTFVKKIDVYRYANGLMCPKVIYHTTHVSKKKTIDHILRLMLMIRRVNYETRLGIGIYEMPHGLLAFIVGKIKRIPITICIIGNPGYTKIRRGIYKKITYFILNRVAAITVTGSRSKEYLLNDGIGNVPVHILPNSIDVEYFKKDRRPKLYDIISLGRLSPEKELCTILAIVARLKKVNGDNIRCAIAGQGPEEKHLQDVIKQMDLEKNVELVGYISDIVGFYNSGKIFVITSSTEGLPRTVLEAMACGIPCIASRVGDMEDAIINGANGYLIEKYNDVDAYVGKISMLLSDQLQYELFAENAQTHVRKKFSYNEAGRVWLEIIKSIKGDMASA